MDDPLNQVEVVPAEVDPLPTPEEIASAAAAANRPSSLKDEGTAVANLKGLGKGLGGAGLGAKRKPKGGAGSTISAATAPAALAVRKNMSGGGRAAAGSSTAPAAAGAAVRQAEVQPQTPPAGEITSSSGAGSSRDLKKSDAGAQSFNLKLRRDTLEDADGPGEEGSIQDPTEDEALIPLAVAAADASATGKAPGISSGRPMSSKPSLAAAAGCSSPATWRDSLYDAFDSSALAVCGGVLAVCLGSLLVLGGGAWLRSRR